MLEVNSLSVAYERRSQKVLNNITFNLSGEKAVIIGPNGSGKTTLLKAVLGLVHMDSGNVELFGKGSGITRGEVRVSANLPEIYQLTDLAVGDIVRMYAELKGGEPSEALEMILDFGLSPILHLKLHELSTGQKKMLCNIMAVSFSPALVLLDEPFENVDQNRRIRFLQKLNELRSDVLVTSHEISLLRRLNGWALYFMMDGSLWGKFSASQVERLYLTKGKVKGAIATAETNLGEFSFTLDRGDAALSSATTLSDLMERVRGD